MKWSRGPAAGLSAALATSLCLSASAQTADDLGNWCESATPAIRLIGDLNRSEQAAIITRFSHFAPMVEPFLPGQPTARPAPLKVIVFSSQRNFERLTGKRKFAGFMQPSLQTNRLLIGPIRKSLTETAQHEFAHYLLRSRLDVSLPTWFDEGLSSLLGATEIVGDQAVVGRLPVARMRERTRYEVTGESPLRSLNRSLAATSVENWSQQRIDAFYDWSWLLTHYLYFGESGDGVATISELTDYLSSGNIPITEQLGLSERGLLRALERHIRRLPDTQQIDLEPAASAPIQYRCLDGFERDHELANAILAQNPDAARSLLTPHMIDHAESVDFLVSLARVELADDNLEASQKLAQRALKLAPRSANAEILSADLRVQNCLFRVEDGCAERWLEASALYRSAIRSDPSRIDAVLGLGLSYLYTGRAGEAVNYLRVAYARMPWAAVANFYLGESYRLIGDSRARGHLRNARNWAVLPVWRLLAEESLSLLDSEPVGAESDLR